MNLAHLEPLGGAAGDMFAAACLDAGLIPEARLRDLVARAVPDAQLRIFKDHRCGILGTRLQVVCPGGRVEGPDEPHHHPHIPYRTVRDGLEAAALPPEVRHKALELFARLASAEARVHGVQVDEVRFHEVGAADSVADVVMAAACLLAMEDRVKTTEPPPLGRGMVRMAHGTMPAPGPAVLELLKGRPVLPGDPVGEQTTPTGAAILLDFQPGPMPAMVLTGTGYGHGTRDPKGKPNTLRLLLGRTEDEPPDLDRDLVYLLETNVDDQPPDLTAPGLRDLLDQGALEVWLTPALGKKSRQTTVWSVLAPPDLKDLLALALMRHTGSIGVRISELSRLKLKREHLEVEWQGHRLRAKRVWGPGIRRIRPETDDLIALSRELGIPLLELSEKIRAWLQDQQ